VPADQSRLDFSIAYTATSELFDDPMLALIDPKGRYAANSDPQGISGYGNVDVRTPAAGTWTALVSNLRVVPDGGFNGPATPGDSAGSLAISSSPGGATSIPVTVRTLVNVASGGGNGRSRFGQDNYYSFTVPAGTPTITASVLISNNPVGGIYAGAYLVSPDGNVLGSGENYDFGTTTATCVDSYKTLDVNALSPDKGAWTLIVVWDSPASGAQTGDPFTGQVTFAAAGKVTGALPAGATLAPKVADTIPVTITNTGTAPADYFLDPRLATTTTLTLAPLTGLLAAGSNTSPLPLSASDDVPTYLVPSQSAAIAVKQTSTVPAMTDLTRGCGPRCRPSAACSRRPPSREGRQVGQGDRRGQGHALPR
jgi:hypothetical protein